jgi:hypothetical protein
MAGMFRLAAALILSPAAFAQAAQESEIAIAAKSPIALARYVESHSTVDWNALRSALGLKEAIVIIRGGVLSYTVEYIRYLQDPKGRRLV